MPIDTPKLLVTESERDGSRFFRRLADEWVAGTHRFDRPTERLFGARVGGMIVGVCGLNADLYAEDPTNGPVRRLYVLKAYCCHGISVRMVRAGVDGARGRFQLLRART